MADDQSEGAETIPSGPGQVEDTSVGVDGDGADNSGQDADGGDETSPDTTDTESPQADGDDALLAALANGKMDDLDSEGAAKAKTEDAEGEPEAKADDNAEGDEPEDKTPDEKPPEDEETAREKAMLEKARTKAERKDIANLFKERREQLRPAKAFAEAVVKHAESAGLIRRTDTGLDTTGLSNLIESEKRIAALTPKEQADHFRKLADTLYPDVPKASPKPVELPQDLKDAVTYGYIKEDEATAIAEKRNPAAKPEEVKPAPKPETKVELPKGPSPEATQQGYAAIAGVAKGYKERFSADWDVIAAKVQKQIEPLLKDAPPSAWKGIAELAMKAEAAERKQAVKKPTPTTRPSGVPQRKAGDLMTEAEEADALAHGRTF